MSDFERIEKSVDSLDARVKKLDAEASVSLAYSNGKWRCSAPGIMPGKATNPNDAIRWFITELRKFEEL